MATANGNIEPTLNSARHLLDSQLNKSESILKHLVLEYDKKDPNAISSLGDHLHKIKPFKLKMKTEKAESLTKIQTMNQLRDALQVALELELTVMYEYLFACFSVINNSDEVEKNGENSPYFSEICREFKNQFIIISNQEMHHFRMANDMLISIGGVPDIQKVKFPSDFGEDHQSANLHRLHLQSLLLFAKNEEPYGGDESNSEHESDFTTLSAIGEDETEDGFVFLSIAQLYGAITNGFKTIHGQIGDLMFTKKQNMKLLRPEFPYTDLKTCLETINIIETQGEGAGGGKIFHAFIDELINWLEHVRLPDNVSEEVSQKGETLRLQLVEISKELLKDVTDLIKVLKGVNTAIKLIGEWEDLKLPSPPIDKSRFLTILEIEPSHWGRFLVMIINYMTLMKKEMEKDAKDNEGTENIVDTDNEFDLDFCALFSRPSCPTPDESGYKETTEKVIKIAETSFQLLLKLLEGSMIAIPDELDKKYKITERYKNIRFYPVMTVLILPLGELLTYFQLSETQTDKTAGFPFTPNENDSILRDPLEKFQDIVLTMKMLYEDSCRYFDDEFYENLGSSVGMWLTDNRGVVARAKNLLKNIQKTIRVLYLGMTNGLSPVTKVSEKKKPTQNLGNSKETTYTDKYYLSIEFNGRAIFKQPSDPDPTFETRGFSGNMFMYEYPGDPDHDNSFYTQNKGLYNDDERKLFKRDYVPEEYYKGVKITSVKLVYPCYYEGTEKKDKELKEIEKCLKYDLENSDFCFYPLVYNGVTYKPTIPQLNYAITRHVGVDPVFVGFKSKKGSFDVKRANLFINPETYSPDPSIDFITACLKLSENFAAYPFAIDDRLPKSGGYLSWRDPFQIGSGCLVNTNAINVHSGTGQCQWDYYTLLSKRCDKIRKDITEIVLRYKDDPLAKLILEFINFYSSKLIILALMTEMKPEDRNKLSYLCSRYLQLTKMKDDTKLFGFFRATGLQYLFQVPLNAPANGHYFVAENNSRDPKLKKVHFMKEQNWGLEFWLGGMDYDALTFFISGNLMIPVTITLES